MARTQRRPLSNPNIQGVLVLGAVLAISFLVIWNNQQPEQHITPPVIRPSATQWQLPVQQELANLPSATPLPPEITPFQVPTLPPTEATVESIRPNEVPGITPTQLQGQNVVLTTPSPSPFFLDATPIPIPTQFIVDPGALPIEGTHFQLPPEQVPLSRGPHDHFLLVRPVNIAANSQYLYYYPYGSGGTGGWRIHRGLDLPNPSGVPVIATGSGEVVWACSADCEYSEANLGDLEVYESYGNFVVIEHDFGWRGERIWTLYAHMSAVVVHEGDRVKPGQTIGLVGISGQVTGPHVHYEVRVGTNSYANTRNPLLWMAPYLNHGLVAGQVLDGDGEFIEGASVQINTETGRRVDQTLTYVDPCDGSGRYCQVVPDTHWNENYVLGDIAEGEYELSVIVDGQKYTRHITVQAGTVTFVEPIQIDVVATPQVFVTDPPDPDAPPPTAIPTLTP